MATVAAGSGSDVPHIGAAPHVGRNLGMVAGAVAIVAAAGAFIFVGGRSDARESQKLEAFMGSYAAKCDDRAETTPLMTRLYLHSPQLQAAVAAQTTALEAGASCLDVYTALHAADLPLPRPAVK